MDISSFYGYTVFRNFQEVVDWLFSYVPFVLLVVFVLNVVFNIIYYLMHMGGKW